MFAEWFLGLGCAKGGEGEGEGVVEMHDDRAVGEEGLCDGGWKWLRMKRRKKRWFLVGRLEKAATSCRDVFARFD